MNDELTFNGYAIRSMPTLIDGKLKYCAIVLTGETKPQPSFIAESRDRAEALAKDWCSEKTERFLCYEIVSYPTGRAMVFFNDEKKAAFFEETRDAAIEAAKLWCKNNSPF